MCEHKLEPAQNSYEEGSERHPEGRLHCGVAHNSGVALLFLVHLDIYHIVLLEIVYGRGVQIFGRAKVYLISCLLAIVLANNLHVGALTCNVKVTKSAEGIKDGEFVSVNLNTSSAHITKDDDIEVGVVNSYNRVCHILLLDERLTDSLLQFLTIETCHVYLTKFWETDASL